MTRFRWDATNAVETAGGTPLSHATDGRQSANVTLLQVFIEYFFATLPLIVLGLSDTLSRTGIIRFLVKPEVSVVACVIYGLTIARLLQAMPFMAKNANSNTLEGLAAAYISLILIPLLGVAISCVMIARFDGSFSTIVVISTQISNLLVSSILFFVLGGYGINRARQRAGHA